MSEVGKKILVLGSGSVARPCVEYLSRNQQNFITVGCRSLASSQKLSEGIPRATAISIDVASPQELDVQVASHDVVISLVPTTYHATVIKSAIKAKTHVVTTSYISPAIRELEAEIKAAGIVVINEVGLDPGIDHIWAIKMINEIHARGGKVAEFHSYCGGLPAPELADNPLRFRFSWSPRGSLLAQCNSAEYLSDGQVVHIKDVDLMDTAAGYPFLTEYNFEAYPNRNSVPFREFYRIPEARTVIRGSLRYKGNPAVVGALTKLGWLSSEEKPWLQPGMSWAQIQQRLVGVVGSDEASIVLRVEEICKFPSPQVGDQVVSALRWMGIFSHEAAPVQGTLIDTLAAHLAGLISLGSDERDLVVLQHRIVSEWSDGHTETHTATLERFGEANGHRAMAVLVGTPCGIATQLFLDGCPPLQQSGLLAPYSKAVCDPIRERLEAEGITLAEDKH